MPTQHLTYITTLDYTVLPAHTCISVLVCPPTTAAAAATAAVCLYVYRMQCGNDTPATLASHAYAHMYTD